MDDPFVTSNKVTFLAERVQSGVHLVGKQPEGPGINATLGLFQSLKRLVGLARVGWADMQVDGPL